MKKIFGFICFLLLAGSIYAQEVVSGNVYDEDGEPLIGAVVKVAGTTIAEVTGVDGDFTISAPSDESTLEISYVGYTTQKFPVSADFSNIQLAPDAFGIDDVVVTGVASGTSRRKLGFTVAKVNNKDLREVPGADAANALRGKVAGVRVVQPSGDPANAAEIRLRGSTTINGSQRPLILVDGVIIQGGDLRDINMEDVESIEVVKGAAAASLYGSLAGNGVVQITTKRGTAGGESFQVGVRSEVGVSSLFQKYPTSTRHSFLVDDNGFIVTQGGVAIPDPDGLKDNLYPVLYDNQDAVFRDNIFYSLNTSMSGTTENANYYFAYQKWEQQGVVDGLLPFEKDNVRLNADFKPTDKLKISGSASWNTQGGYNTTEAGQGANIFYGILSAQPYINLLETDADGNPVVTPTGYNIDSENFQNPLYTTNVLTQSFDRDRLIGGITVNYALTDWVELVGQQTLDRLDGNFLFAFPKDYVTPATPGDNGLTQNGDFLDQAKISQVQANFTKTFFQDFNTKLTAKYAFEDYDRESLTVLGRRPLALGVPVLTNAEEITVPGNSIIEEHAESYLLDGTFDYKDKIIVNANIRREGTSLNAADERYQTFGRGALAYIVTEDFDLPGIDFLKLRGSYGTAGNRPGFGSIYETLNVSQSGISFGQSGNALLRSSTISETEVGFDLGFLNKFNLVASYSNSDTENDFLNVSLPLGFGFTSQVQNVGELNSEAFELSLNGILVDKKDWGIDFGLNWDKITQEIVDLGDVPAFTRVLPGANNSPNLFRVEEDLPYGTMYGNKLVRSLDQLVTNDAGEVINIGAGAGTTVNDYSVDENGFVIQNGVRGTSAESQLLQVDSEGNALITEIGNTNPNFNIGFTSNFRWKGFSLYTLLDYQDGGDIYNYTKQLMFFQERHEEQDVFAAQGHHVNYFNANSRLYQGVDGTSGVDYYVEDGTFLKIREVSLGYNFDQDRLSGMGLNKVFQGAKLAITGRNLFTFTDYTGWDPEVALNTNPTNFRLDEFAYPNYRTLTGRLELTF